MEETSYSVSQAVKLLEVQSHVLRYWEEELGLPIQRNGMGHRYYTRCDIQIFLSIKELKKKGYSLKEIGELTPFFYKNSNLKKEKRDKEDIPGKDRLRKEKVKEEKTGKERQNQARGERSARGKGKAQKVGEDRLPPEFMDIVSRMVAQRMKEQSTEEARYKRLDERIRSFQKSRREVAAAAEKKNTRKRRLRKRP